jgi:uncharacterized glyoxalase superfamily protein PhnB
MINSLYPVLMVEDVAKMSAFYQEVLEMELTFASDWYVSLKKTTETGLFQLALLQSDHATIPQGFREPSQGVLINYEIEDVDALHQRLVSEKGLPVHLELRDEDWGQRHFITADPEGNLLDCIQLIEPSAEFLAQYTEGLQ